jgi:hypothetical protein
VGESKEKLMNGVLVYGYTSSNCGGGAVLVASEGLTTCVTDGNHAFLSFMVVTPCFTN